MRIALVLEYDGSRYHGWQKQRGLFTIQQQVEEALGKIVHHDLNVVCAGRTDTGVHATNQVIHFNCAKELPLSAWVRGTNNYLPQDIAVKCGFLMPDSFHARYSALARHYRYFIYNAPTRPALFTNKIVWQYRQLNHKVMQEASKYLLGEHDYSSFRAAECQSKSTMRNIYTLKIHRHDKFIIVDLIANAFLHHMVRNIVGVLTMVGIGKKPPLWVKEVLQAKDRSMAAATAPAHGLYLIAVSYPKEFTSNLSVPPFYIEQYSELPSFFASPSKDLVGTLF